MSETKVFTSQLKAQQFVKSLIKKGLEPGIDFITATKNGSYEVCVYKRIGLFGA